MNNRKLVQYVIYATSAVAVVVMGLKLTGFIPSPVFKAIVFGKLLGIFYFFSGVFLYKRGFHLGESLFLLVVMGGMLIRMGVLLAAILLIPKVLKINEFSFILVVFIFYILYLCAEIFYLHNMQTTKKLINSK